MSLIILYSDKDHKEYKTSQEYYIIIMGFFQENKIYKKKPI